MEKSSNKNNNEFNIENLLNNYNSTFKVPEHSDSEEKIIINNITSGIDRRRAESQSFFHNLRSAMSKILDWLALYLVPGHSIYSTPALAVGSFAIIFIIGSAVYFGSMKQNSNSTNSNLAQNNSRIEKNNLSGIMKDTLVPTQENENLKEFTDPLTIQIPGRGFNKSMIYDTIFALSKQILQKNKITYELKSQYYLESNWIKANDSKIRLIIFKELTGRDQKIKIDIHQKAMKSNLNNRDLKEVRNIRDSIAKHINNIINK
jgi:hypothetical protein